MARILAFAGSTRTGSLNRRLLEAVVPLLEAAGATVTRLDLRDHPLPLYDGDLEAATGIPEPALRLREVLSAHHGLLIASPEYNGSVTPLLKNALDWASRPRGDEPPLVAFRGKVAGLAAASPGALGGLRGLGQVRHTLTVLGVHVIPAQVAVPRADQVLGASGEVGDERVRRSLEALARDLVRTTERLAG